MAGGAWMTKASSTSMLRLRSHCTPVTKPLVPSAIKAMIASSQRIVSLKRGSRMLGPPSRA